MQKIKELITHCGKKILQYRTTGQLQSITKNSKVPCVCQRGECNHLIIPGIIMHLTMESIMLVKIFLYLKF